MNADRPVSIEPAAAPPGPSGPYAGLVTRAVAFTIDALIINAIALGGVVVVASVALVLHLGGPARVIVGEVGAGAYLVWVVGYFVAFWCTTGQTPGGRAMRFSILSKNGGTIGPFRALVRWVGIVVSAILLGLGFVPILFDERRRGLQDRLAGTLAVDSPEIGDEEVEQAPRELDPPVAERELLASQAEPPTPQAEPRADEGSARLPAERRIQAGATGSPLTRYG